MGEGEILRLWANVWLSPAFLPAGFPVGVYGRKHHDAGRHRSQTHQVTRHRRRSLDARVSFQVAGAPQTLQTYG